MSPREKRETHLRLRICGMFIPKVKGINALSTLDMLNLRVVCESTEGWPISAGLPRDTDAQVGKKVKLKGSAQVPLAFATPENLIAPIFRAARASHQ